MLRTLFVSLAVLLAASDTATSQQPTAETRIKIVAADSGPAELRMTGPTVGAVAQPLMIVVSGLPAVDLGKTVGEQTKWIDTLRFDVSTPDGKSAVLDKELSMSVSPWEWRLRLTLTPPSAGVYVVVCDWNTAPFGLALHRVTVGGVTPPVNPPDTPPVVPTTTATALILLETETSDQAHELLRNLLRRDPALSPRVAILDPDQQDENNQPDKQVVAAKAYLIGRSPPVPLPAVVGVNPDGSFVWADSLPATFDALKKLLIERGMK